MEILKKPKTPPKNPSKFNFSSDKQVVEKPMSSDLKNQKNSKVAQVEPVFEKTVKPKNNKIIFISLSIILLAILIAVSTALIIIFPTAKRMNDIKIDFSAISKFEPISITPEGDGPKRETAMPGDKINCYFKVQSKKDPNFTEDVNLDVFIRFKISLNTENNLITSDTDSSAVNVDFVDNIWMKGVDGYFYLTKTDKCDGVLSPGEILEITKSFYLSTEIGNEYAGKEVGIYFEVEALQANYQAIKELWTTAPYQWYIQFKDLI